MSEQPPVEPLALHSPQRTRVAGRYRVLVESIEPTGEARGAVVRTIDGPTQDELAQVYRRTNVQAPETLRFIGGLPGELVEVTVEWSLPRAGRRRVRRTPEPSVRVDAVIEPVPERTVATCAVFGVCGGCQLQHMTYPAQLRWKTERVQAELSAVGLDPCTVLPASGCEPPWGYRNHMRFSVNREGQPGLTARNSHRVLPLTTCPIAHPRINEALAILSTQPLPRPQALIRYAEASGQMLLQPAVSDGARAQLEASGLDVRAEEMEERLCGIPYRIRPSSFFQTNTRTAERMAALVLERLPTEADTTLVDAYCGVGTFAALLAPHVGRVVAIEESASAIRDARWNLRDAPNVSIVQAKVEDALPGLVERLDGLVIDPPRAGCQLPVLNALVARRVPRVVYVSCNPNTLARDLAYLCQRLKAFRVVDVQPLDMFPQTAHIESIATLEAI
jgi:23S rRNA (uracil1939-C5)-methyltransferase